MTSMPLPRLVIVVTSVFLLSACTDTAAQEGPSGVASSPAIIAAPDAALLPRTVAELPPMDVDGFHELLGQLRGTPVVVNVWASWCDPCIREAPLLASAARTHRDVQFLGVDHQDGRGGAETFIAQYGIPYPSVFDPPGAILTDLEAFAPPATVFYDADGNQTATVIGELSKETLAEHLRAIDH
jgi:cytochrome c biogenesis protein CcmG/thiol:disulfide interchange protein DsbE